MANDNEKLDLHAVDLAKLRRARNLIQLVNELMKTGLGAEHIPTALELLYANPKVRAGVPVLARMEKEGLTPPQLGERVVRGMIAKGMLKTDPRPKTAEALEEVAPFLASDEPHFAKYFAQEEVELRVRVPAHLVQCFMADHAHAKDDMLVRLTCAVVGSVHRFVMHARAETPGGHIPGVNAPPGSGLN